ncbi:MAG: hypothetical protein ACRDHS_10290 [Actinomycetota bacterium]
MGVWQRLREARGLFGFPVDRADAYMRRHAHAPRMSQRAIRRPTEPIDSEPRRRAGESGREAEEDFERPWERLSREFGDYFDGKARQALDEGTCVIRTNVGVVQARVLRFRDGYGIFETETKGPGGNRGSGLIKLYPEHFRPDILAVYLAGDVANLGGDAMPFPD